MEKLKVFFTSKIDKENIALSVFSDQILIAEGPLNICTNWAHVNILKGSSQAFEDMEHEIEKAIEDRRIIDNRIELAFND